jgi:hypothetical protein
VETPGFTNEEEIQDSIFRGDVILFLGNEKGLYWKPTWKSGVLLFVLPWCTLLAERPCLHFHSSKETDAIKVKLRSLDQNSTNSKHPSAEVSVANLKICFGESADNLWLPYISTM